MQGIGVIFGEGAGELALQKWRLVFRQFRQNFKPRVDFVHYTPSQRTFYAITTDILRHRNVHSTPSKRSFYAITTDILRHHNGHSTPSQRTIIVHYPPSLAYIYANPTQSNRSFRHTYSIISIAIIIVYHPHIQRHIHR